MPSPQHLPLSLRLALCFAGLSGLWSVGMGAAASHALVGVMAAEDIARVDKAVTYQFYHTLALVLTVLLHSLFPHRIWRISAMLFVLGILGFSGALYWRAFFGASGISALAPYGGLSWMAGWLSLAVGSFLVHRSK